MASCLPRPQVRLPRFFFLLLFLVSWVVLPLERCRHHGLTFGHMRDAQNRARRTYGASAVGSFTVAAGTITGACPHYTYFLPNHEFYCFNVEITDTHSTVARTHAQPEFSKLHLKSIACGLGFIVGLAGAPLLLLAAPYPVCGRRSTSLTFPCLHITRERRGVGRWLWANGVPRQWPHKVHYMFLTTNQTTPALNIHYTRTTTHDTQSYRCTS